LATGAQPGPTGEALITVLPRSLARLGGGPGGEGKRRGVDKGKKGRRGRGGVGKGYERGK